MRTAGLPPPPRKTAATPSICDTLLRDDGVGVLEDRREIVSVGSECQRHHWKAVGVRFGIGRRLRHVLWQPRRRGIDRGLDRAGGFVEVFFQPELQRISCRSR